MTHEKFLLQYILNIKIVVLPVPRRQLQTSALPTEYSSGLPTESPQLFTNECMPKSKTDVTIQYWIKQGLFYIYNVKIWNSGELFCKGEIPFPLIVHKVQGWSKKYPKWLNRAYQINFISIFAFCVVTFWSWIFGYSAKILFVAILFVTRCIYSCSKWA